VKRSGRDESIEVVIHMCTEETVGISVYNYPYLKQAKTLCLSYYCLCLLFNKIEEKGRTGSSRGWGEARGWGEVRGAGGQGKKWHKQCMHV
jgi:hypothetical protein